MKKIKLFREHPLLTTWLSTAWSLAYGSLHLFLALNRDPYWYFTMAMFFLAIGCGRLIAVSKKGRDSTRMRIIAGLIAFLAIVICGITYLSIDRIINPIRNRILVIAHAAFAFTIISVAIYNVIISQKRKDSRMIMVKALSLAAGIGSALSVRYPIHCVSAACAIYSAFPIDFPSLIHPGKSGYRMV